MLHCLLQVVVASVLFWGWTLVIFNRITGSAAVTYRSYFTYCLLVAVGLIIDNLRAHDLKADLLNLDFIRNSAISFRQTMTVLVVLLLFLVGLKDQAISRAFLFSYIPTLFFLFFYSNHVFPRFLARFVFSGRYLQNTVLMGAWRPVLAIRQWLDRKSYYGFRLVGLVTDDPEAETSSGLPVLGLPADLEKHIRDVGATQLIAVGWPSDLTIVNELADICQRLGVRLLVAGDFESAMGRKVMLIEDDGIHLIGFYREPLECPFNRVMKRVLDLMIAVPAVLFILPVFAVAVWLLQRWQAPGPLVFRQARTGMQDRDFTIYKFRTMYVGNPNEVEQAKADDQRVFPAGRWLRRLSIDEFPQFVNVLKGEMSVVGPRPHLRAHDELFKQAARAYSVRAFIKPGMTGLAQVRDFRGETRTEQQMVDSVQSDLDYLENWSFLLDGMIILRTVWKLVFPPKASY